MADNETVKVDISVHIDQHDPAADTGLTVEEWNALDNDERSGVVEGIWNTMVQTDDGGTRVVTPGAKGIW